MEFRLCFLLVLLVKSLNADSGSSGVCGGPRYINTDNGQILSHARYNGRTLYPNNARCRWTITAPAGQIISLKSDSFDVEDDARCDYDYVEFYDGSTSSSRLIGRYCGDGYLPTMTSTGNKMFFKFVSDESDSYSGFQLEYKFLVRPTHAMVCKSDEFQCPADGACISASYLCDGDNDCGDMTDEDKNNCQVKTVGPTSSPTTQVTLAPAGGLRCGSPSLQNGTSGQFNTVNYGTGNYGNDLACKWTITVPQGKTINLTFSSDFDIESYGTSCDYDRVLVYNGVQSTRNLLGRFCNHLRPPLRLTSTGNKVTVVFVSDDSIGLKGFSASWTTDNIGVTSVPVPVTTKPITTSNKCGSNPVQTGTRGSFSSDNWPNKYGPNKNCQWVITVPQGKVIRIAFNANGFEIEDDRTCSYDYVDIYNYPKSDANFISGFCGDKAPRPMTTASNQAIVEFLSDDSVSGVGFKIYWTAVDAAGSVKTTPSGNSNNPRCGGDTDSFTAPTGIITSHNTYNGVNRYPNNLNCKWTITAPVGKSVELTFKGMQIEQGRQCQYDWLEIRDGSTKTKFCNPSQPPPVFTSRGNQLNLVFESDDGVRKIGFKLTYRFVDGPGQTTAVMTKSTRRPVVITTTLRPSVAMTTTPPTTTTPSSCGATFIGKTSGSFTSPNFGGTKKYPNDAVCAWKIVAPGNDMVVSLTFTSFAVEPDSKCDFDKVVIYDGPSSSSKVIRTLCGAGDRSKIVSTGDTMYIVFTSDDSLNERGFSAAFSVAAPPPTCSSVQFTCNNGKCIDSNKKCDKTRDCDDGSDELLCGSDVCGTPAIAPDLSPNTNRIVGGKVAKEGSWPWQVSLRYRSSHVCGATMISAQWILTAAHCFDDSNVSPRYWSVMAADHGKFTQDASQQLRVASKIYIHQQYDEDSNANDIALIKLSQAVTLNTRAIPVCLPTSLPQVGKTCYSTGWGDTKGTGSRNYLNQVDVKIISSSTCNGRGWYYRQLTSDMVCAGYAEGQKDTCQGDSGGPMVCQTSSGKWQIEGVTSWGIGCASRQKPGVYTVVYNYLDWIRQKMQT